MCYSALVKRDLDYLERNFGAVAVREQIDRYEVLSAQDPKAYPPPADRIYPGHYAPVIHQRNGNKVIELMRYGAYPPASVPTPQRYTTYNARRDNLTSPFWSEAFMQHHGFVVLGGFFEWVAVHDLIAAGEVNIDTIAAHFHKQAQLRKDKVLAAGKRYQPTPTEEKPPMERKVTIAFYPKGVSDLIVPVIFSHSPMQSAGPQSGFAIVTDEPPLDVARAGHDRCPIILAREGIERWINLGGKGVRELVGILDGKVRLDFAHALAEP